MKKMTTAAAVLALLAGLTGCSLFPSPPPPPDIAPATPVSVLPPECPFVGNDDVMPVRIPKGTPRESIGSVFSGTAVPGLHAVTSSDPAFSQPL